MSLRLKALPSAIAHVIALGAFSSLVAAPALAQSSDADAAAAPPMQRVEITGSNIRRADAETPSPVQVLSAADLKNSGYTSVADVMQHITANGAGALVQSFRDGFAAGGGGVSLHGLNDNLTLVLIDGHRMASYPLADDGQRSFVDLSNIPFDAVERIEILKDGASAVYGSDAIAGVVNVILKKNVVGTMLSTETGTSTEGGGTTTHATLTHGVGKLEDDGYNAYLALEFRDQNPIYYSERQGDGLWQTLNWAPYGGVNTTPGVITPQNPRPATLTPYLVNPNVPFSGAPNSSVFFPGACSSYAQLAGGGCAYQARGEIQSRVRNVNVLGSFTKKLDDGWKLDLKGSMFESRDALPTAGYATFPSSFSPLIAISSGVAPHFVGNAIPAITVPA
ncbi:MAG TPA: Plug domain-containing protein, partial [Telluria sp.]